MLVIRKRKRCDFWVDEGVSAAHGWDHARTDWDCIGGA